MVFSGKVVDIRKNQKLDLYVFGICFQLVFVVLHLIVRYPLDEAASIAISTVKQFGKDFKEVKLFAFPLHFSL